MHTVTVFHVNWEKAGVSYVFKPTEDTALALFEDPSTKQVAEVTYPPEASMEEVLEHAYFMTNSIEWPWYENDDETLKVSDEARNGCRSTSVGDIMAIGDALFVVKGFGFRRLHSPA